MPELRIVKMQLEPNDKSMAIKSTLTPEERRERLLEHKREYNRKNRSSREYRRMHYERWIKNDPTRHVWRLMKYRCRPYNKKYPYYQSMGIGIDPRWNDYANFLADMGPIPPGARLTRLDKLKGYGPDNCEWRLTHCRVPDPKVHGINIGQLAKKYGLTYHSTDKRVVRGWLLEESLGTPQYGHRFAKVLGVTERQLAFPIYRQFPTPPITLNAFPTVKAMKKDDLQLLDAFIISATGPEPTPRKMIETTLVGLCFMGKLLGNLIKNMPHEDTDEIIHYNVVKLLKTCLQDGAVMQPMVSVTADDQPIHPEFWEGISNESNC